MNIILDLLILLVIVVSALIGKKRGFIRTFFSFFGSLISFVLSSVLARPVGSFLSEKWIEPAIRQYFMDSFLERAGSDAQGVDFAALPDACKELLQRFDFGEQDLAAFFAEAQEAGANTLERIASAVAEPISGSIGYAVALFVLFIVISLVVRVLVKALDLLSKLPFLNFSNHTLGLLAGIAWGVVLAVMLSSVLTLVEPMMQGSEIDFLQKFNSEKTFLVRFFSSFDIFKNLFFLKG